MQCALCNHGNVFVFNQLHVSFCCFQEKILQPSFLSYKELLLLNVQEVTSRLSSSSSTTDPSYFKSLMEHLQSPTCTLADFRRIHMYLMVRKIRSPTYRIFSNLIRTLFTVSEG
jgi:hypothetical protein